MGISMSEWIIKKLNQNEAERVGRLVNKFKGDEASVLEYSEEHAYKERQVHSRPGFGWRFLLNMI